MNIDELELSTSSRPTRRGSERPRRRPPRLGRWVAAIGILAALGLAAWFAAPPLSRPEPEPPAVATWPLEVSSDPTGVEILVDGSTRGTTPTTVQLEGPEGRTASIYLVRDGEIVAEREVEVGPGLPERWVPRLQRPPVEFRVVSRPAGATVYLGDQHLPGVTPLTVALDPDARHRLRIELADFHEESLTFRLADLRDSQREQRELFFPLREVVLPATLVVHAPFPVRLTTGGQTWNVEGRQAISLKPGRREVVLRSASVVYEERLTLDLAPNETRDLRLPGVVTVRVMAQPSRCRLSVDGREIDWLPADVALPLGSHQLTFVWDQLGAQRTVEVEVTPETERFVVSATGGGAGG